MSNLTPFEAYKVDFKNETGMEFNENIQTYITYLQLKAVEAIMDKLAYIQNEITELNSKTK